MPEDAERFRFFSSGSDLYPHLRKLIEEAREEILVSVYAFHDDRIGREFAGLLARKARAGVRVRVIFDSLGSWGAQHRLLRKLRRGGVRARLFRDKASYPWLHPASFLYRNHSRLMLIDRKYFGLGGLAIGEIYEKRQDCFWLGEIRNSVPLADLFQDYWVLAGHPGRLKSSLAEPFQVAPGISALVSGPFRSEAEIYDWLLARIRRARGRIVLVATWFLPTRELLGALRAACARGVRITLVTPLATDRERYDGFRALPMSRLLKRVQWYGTAEYFHQKYFLVDEAWCLGSANFDILSLRRNYELDICGEGGPVLSYLDKNYRELIAGEKHQTHHPAPFLAKRFAAWSYGLVEWLFTAHPLNSGPARRRLVRPKEA